MANPKQQPANLDVERQVLGAIITDVRAMDKAALKLHPEDFYSPKNRAIYEAALDLWAKRDAIDTTTLSHKAPQYAAAINEAAQAVRDSENVDTHVGIIKTLSKKRVVLGIANDLVRMAYDKELEEVQAYAKSVITKILSDDGERSRLLSPADQAEVMREYVAKKRAGDVARISSGYPRLDKLIGGLRRGDLIVIAARTSVGKSTYAENIAENVAHAGHRVMFVSIEMDPEQMAYRFMKRAGASESLLEYGADDAASQRELERLIDNRLNLPLLIHNEPTADTIKIRSMLNQAMAEHGPVDLIVVDYLQLMTDTFGGKIPEHLRLGMITKTLKSIAREYRMPVILLSQLNRNSDQRGVLPEPRLSDIRESGRIEEDADTILFLWKVEPDVSGNDTKLKIAKNRQGPTGEVPVKFFKPQFKFSEPTEQEIIRAAVPEGELDDALEILKVLAGKKNDDGEHTREGEGSDPETPEETEEGVDWETYGDQA